MMTTLREKTALVLWFVIFAFIGLIVVEWGADYGGSGQQEVGDAVGVINGEKISLKDFQGALRQASSQTPREQREDQGALVRQVWDAYLQEVLLRQEIERLGVQVTDKEVAYYTRTQPPAAVQAIESFQTEGQFDMAKYTQFIGDPANLQDPNNRGFVMQIEYMLRQQLLNFKLQRLLMSGVQVTPAEVRQLFSESNEKSSIEFVFAPGSAVADDQVEVTDADLAAYYQEHKADYEHPEQVRLSYAYFSKAPSAEDSIAIGEEIIRLGQEIEAGADFAELAEVVSDDQVSAAQGGALGTFGRDRMVKPFSDAAFALEAGQVSEPVQTRFGWHLIKVDDKEEVDGEEKVTASHILLRYAASRRTEDTLRSWADEFQAKAAATGFESALVASGLQSIDAGYLQKNQAISALDQSTAWLVNWGFGQEAGAVSRVAENDNGLWIAVVTAKRPDGYTPLEEIRPRVEREVRAEKKAAMVASKLQEVRTQVAAGTGLGDAASAAGFEVSQPGAFTRGESVQGIGRGNAVVAAAFRLPAGQLSDVITLRQGAYLLRVLEKVAPDEEQFTAGRDQLQQQLVAQRQQEALQNVFAQLYESAEIEDNRHQFFTF
ncbi:MAG: peptidyl-prolyl cis-trans isomerase [Candidatus Latescibacterota bacterium]|jgi:peptidyl-prolyl cis-trans isomerase D